MIWEDMSCLLQIATEQGKHHNPLSLKSLIGSSSSADAWGVWACCELSTSTSTGEGSRRRAAGERLAGFGGPERAHGGRLLRRGLRRRPKASWFPQVTSNGGPFGPPP